MSTFSLIPHTFQCYLAIDRLLEKESVYWCHSGVMNGSPNAISSHQGGFLRGDYNLILQILVGDINNKIITEYETESLSTNIKERYVFQKYILLEPFNTG